jgi:CheY-like chemotaxis protein
MATVLVIDDSATCRKFCRTALEAAGHAVLEAPDGREGLAAFEHDVPDLALCDLFMPEQDGLGFLREARRRRPGAKVLAMSAGGRWARGDFLETALQLGAADALSKPFGREELLEAVCRALGG